MSTKSTVFWAPALLGFGAALGFAWARRARPLGESLSDDMSKTDTRSYRDLLRARHRDSFSPVTPRKPSDIDAAVAP